MRILHGTDCYLPRLGGIELHVRDLAHAQRAAGHDARISTPGDDAGYEPWVTRLAPVNRPALLRSELPDVVHAHISVISPLAMAGSRQAADLDLPVLVTVHSMWPSTPLLGAVAGALLGLARRTMVWSPVSNLAAAPLVAVLGPGSGRPLVLPNAVDPSFWRDEIPTIVSVMRMVHRKRPLAMARMLREVRNRVPADAALEARCAGLPVVASSCGGVGDFVIPGFDGFLGANDHSMGDAITRLVTDRGCCRR